MTHSIDSILSFWFGPEMEGHHFNSTPDIDSMIKQRYESLWASAQKGNLDDWEKSAEGCLALCIVLDQFPLNMFRGLPITYSTEQQAIAISKHAIAQAYHTKLAPERAAFLLLPLMHSEQLEDQDLSVQLAKQLNTSPGQIAFAEHHRAIIVEFGRFPHRNETLSRPSTEAEVRYLSSSAAFNPE